MKFDLTKICVSKNDIKRGLTLPNEMSCELAEFIGILTGDGYMGYYPNKEVYVIEISGNKISDKDYLENYVSNLVKKLFNISPKIYYAKEQNTMYLRILSKGLFNYLIFLGFKSGRKEQIGILEILKNNKNFIKYFVKGLADTDFSLKLMNKPSKKSKYYPIIALRVKSKRLVFEVGKFLKEEGFIINIIEDEILIDKRGYNSTVSSSIILSGRKNLAKWMSDISFRNQSYLDKYRRYHESIKKW